jgi:DNA-binding LytR/AlgR family response regulator
MNCIILDDEPAAVAILERYIQKVPDFQHLQSFHSPTEALAFIKQQSVELIFLDIQMPDLLGTELVKLLPKGTQVFYYCLFRICSRRIFFKSSRLSPKANKLPEISGSL